MKKSSLQTCTKILRKYYDVLVSVLLLLRTHYKSISYLFLSLSHHHKKANDPNKAATAATLMLSSTLLAGNASTTAQEKQASKITA